MDEPGKAPFAAQNVGQQHFVLPAIFAVDLIVRAHHAAHAAIDQGFEVRQINFVQGPLINLYINREAAVFERIERKMLGRGANIVRLDALRQRRPHRAQVMLVLAIGFLRAAPAGVAQQIDAHRARQVAALRPRLDPHRRADPRFKVNIEAGSTRHCARKTGGIAACDPARAIGKPESGDVQPLDPAAGAIRPRPEPAAIFAERLEKAVAGHRADLFLQRRCRHDCSDRLGNFLRRHARARSETRHWAGHRWLTGPDNATDRAAAPG